MPDTTGAQFQEVLEVGVDTAAFSEGLARLESIYSDFLKRLAANGGTGSDIINVGGLASVNDQLQTLTKTITTIATNLGSTLSDITNGITEALGAMDKTITEKMELSSKARIEQSQTEADKRVADARRIVAASNAEGTVSKSETFASFDGRPRGIVSGPNQTEFTQADAKAIGDRLSLTLDAENQRRKAFEETAKVREASSKPTLLDAFISKQSVENIAGMVLGMGELMLVMKAVQLIMDAITLPFKLVSEFLHDGWEYATNLQKSAADLQGVIASTVVLSTDMAANYKLAGEAGVVAVQQLQLISAQTGIAVEQLQSGFKAVLEGGGASFVKDFSELPRLAELFGLAVKATGKDFMVQRTLISEIPQLLAGTETKSSKILETLGLTTQEWEKIRVAGMENHDLLERMEPLLRPFLAVAQDSELRMSGLNAQLELMKNQISAAISQPLWNAWIEVLKEAKKWLSDNKDDLVTIGKEIVTIVLFWGKIAVGFAAWLVDLKDAHNWVSLIADGFKGLSGFTTTLELSFDGLLKKLQKFGELVNSPDFLKPSAWKQFAEDLKKIDAETAQAIQDAATLANGKAGGTPVLGGRTPPPAPVDNLAAVKEDYAKKLAEVKGYFDNVRKLTEAAQKEGKISQDEEAALTLRHLQQEKDALTDLNRIYIEKAKNSGGKPKSIEAFTNKVDKDAINEDRALNNERTANELRFNLFKKALLKEEFNAAIAMNKVILADEIAAAKQFHADRVGYIARLEAQARQLNFAADIKALNDKKLAAGRNILEVAQIQAQIDRTTKQQQDAAITDTQQIKRADFKETEANYKRQNELELATFKLEEQRVNREDKHKTNQREIIADQQTLNEKYRDLLNMQFIRLNALLEEARATQGETDKVQELTAALEKLNKERDRAASNVDKGNPTTEQIGATIFGKGPDGQDINSLKEVFDDGFGKGVEGLTHAFKFFSDTVGNFINAYKQGSASGGILGGLGGVASQAGGLISSIPGGELAGGIISGIGSVMSIVGSLFTAAAKRIAKQIKEQFDQIVKNYQNGTTNLVDTISQLEAKRAEAISRLSGQKGGQDQLNQLLPQFDDELRQLKKQQTDIIKNFENSLEVLRINNDALATFLKTWQDINKQVKDYLDAGGDVNKANEFLSLSLQQAQHKAQDELNAGEQQAIQDALQLNDLLTQRVNLIKDFKRQEFDLVNADSLERRQTGAVSRGQQLSNLRAQFDLQLKALDDQIGLTTQKVAKEQEVFDIAKSAAELHRLDDELTLHALDEQITKYKALKDIITGITLGSNGLYGISPTLAGQIGTTVNNINVTVNGVGSGSNQDLANTIMDTIKSGFGSTPYGG